MEIECVDNYKIGREDIRIFVLNFRWFLFVNDDIYVFGIFKSSLFDSFVCVFEKILLGYGNKSIFFTMFEVGKVYKMDIEVNMGKIEFIFFMLEMGKIYKKDVDLNIMKREVVFFMLEMGRVYEKDVELNIIKIEFIVDIFKMYEVY